MPRLATNVNNFPELPSHEDFVYLSLGYAVHYAFRNYRDDEKMMLVEVEVDEDCLYPDEDFIGAVIAEQTKREFDECVKEVDILEYQFAFKSCFECTSLAAHLGSISPKRITNVYEIDDFNLGLALGADTSPTSGIWIPELWKRNYFKLEYWIEHGTEKFIQRKKLEFEKLQKGGKPDLNWL